MRRTAILFLLYAALATMPACSGSSQAPPNALPPGPGSNAPGPGPSITNVRIQDFTAPAPLQYVAIGSDGAPWATGYSASTSAPGIYVYRNSFSFFSAPPNSDGFKFGLSSGTNGIYGIAEFPASTSLQSGDVLTTTDSNGATSVSPASWVFLGQGQLIGMQVDSSTGFVWWVIDDNNNLRSVVEGGTFAAGPTVTTSLPIENEAYPLAVASDAIYVFDYDNSAATPAGMRKVKQRIRIGNQERDVLPGGVFVVYRISKTTGAILETFKTGPLQQVNDMATGSDGNIWFTDPANNAIWRMTPSGSFVEFALPTANAQPDRIVAGGDGALWFTEDNKIGRITTLGQISEYPVDLAGYKPADIAAPVNCISCNQNVLWFTENSQSGASALGEITFDR